VVIIYVYRVRNFSYREPTMVKISTYLGHHLSMTPLKTLIFTSPELTFQRLEVSLCTTTKFDFDKFYIIPTEYISCCVWICEQTRLLLPTTMTSFYSRDSYCLLLGTNWPLNKTSRFALKGRVSSLFSCI